MSIVDRTTVSILCCSVLPCVSAFFRPARVDRRGWTVLGLAVGSERVRPGIRYGCFEYAKASGVDGSRFSLDPSVETALTRCAFSMYSRERTRFGAFRAGRNRGRCLFSSVELARGSHHSIVEVDREYATPRELRHSAGIVRDRRGTADRLAS
jgi:hypothetical protein